MKVIPRATYRLQISPKFPFSEVEKLLEYLNALGISHLYAAPIYDAREESDHGYDVVNMNAINPRLGGEEGLRQLVAKAHQHGLGWIQDIVPNHRAFDGANPLLMDVLEKGPHSRYYRFFDIMWEHPYENIRGRVLAPFLGNFYSHCLHSGELKLVYTDQGFRVTYYNLSFPIRILSYARILRCDFGALQRRLGRNHQDIVRLTGILTYLDSVEEEHEQNPSYDHFHFVKDLFKTLYHDSPAVREYVESCLTRFNGIAGNHDSFNDLDELLSEQYFRLSFWKVGTEELNYRRFFSINHLICLRVEDPDVYTYTHRLTLQLIRDGIFDGIRLDHIDGLYDPTAYAKRLREDAPNAYIVAEKILHGSEEIPPQWPIDGTSGYDFLNRAQQLLTNGKNEERLEEVYRNFSGLRPSYEEMILDNKRMIIGKHMSGDIDNLALMLKEVANRYRYGRDLTLYALRRALVEILAVFPIYRTYAGEDGFNARDRAIIEKTIVQCIETRPILRNEFELLRRFILRDPDLHLTADEESGWWHFLLRLQQYTGPLMAKGVEDTVFYLYYRLISHNEVGCDPNELAISPEQFHQFEQRRIEKHPHAMNCSSTHDTKRGEDARARIAVLSEIPDEWEAALQNFSQLAKPVYTQQQRLRYPTPNDEYMIYQAMIGALPFEGFDADDFPARLKDFALKAARESGVITSWLNANQGYEEAISHFVDGLTVGEEGAAFREAFLRFHRKIARAGIINSYAQTALKLTTPGVPDIYQGCELWDFSFVDPDNRRPVDFEMRKKLLQRIDKEDRRNLLIEIASAPESGLGKMFLTQQILRLRRDHPRLFAEGSYEPLSFTGDHAENFVGFRRVLQGQTLTVIVPRLVRNHIEEEVLRLTIKPTLSQSGVVRSLLSGNKFNSLADALKEFPVAMSIQG